MPNEVTARVVSVRFLTTEEARTVKDGDYVVTPHSFPPWKPYRVTKTYTEAGKTPMLYIARLAAFGQWLHATGFCRAPTNAHWDSRYGWVEGKTEFGARLVLRLDREEPDA